jgi:hypothetical protein
VGGKPSHGTLVGNPDRTGNPSIFLRKFGVYNPTSSLLRRSGAPFLRTHANDAARSTRLERHDDRCDGPMVRAARSCGKRDRGWAGGKARHETLEAIWTARQILSFAQKFT